MSAVAGDARLFRLVRDPGLLRPVVSQAAGPVTLIGGAGAGTITVSRPRRTLPATLKRSAAVRSARRIAP